MKTLQKIAERHGLELIETTDKSNGYPSNLKGAIIGFENFKQAEEIAEKYNLEISCFEKKDGWHFYYRTGANMYQAFTNSSSDYGDNYSEIPKIDEEDFIENEVRWFLEDNLKSFEQIESFLSAKKEIWKEVDKMEEDEIVITYEGNYYETIKKESMYFYHDTKHFVIGVQEK